MSRSAFRLAITPGEPAGIGPELLVRLAQQSRATGWVAVCDPALLARTAQRLQLDLSINSEAHSPSNTAGSLTVLPVSLKRPEVPGELDVENAAYVVETLKIATDGCLSKKFDGIVTGPVQKSIINDAGTSFSGHTEFFCERSGADDVVMLLVAGSLRVALATTHLPLKEVSNALTRELLVRRLDLLVEGLKDRFELKEPRILVAGLNPHAGEAGHLGSEEIAVITPVCEQFRAKGHRVTGPLAADTLFTPAYLQDADAVLAMYHDQGLPVLKYQGFGRAVNVTLGLPFVRTSVDHGTALDLAGTGKADPGSFAAAIDLAEKMLVRS